MSREMWEMEGDEAGNISRHKATKSPGGQAEGVAERRNLREESTATPQTPLSMRSFQNECTDLHQL